MAGGVATARGASARGGRRVSARRRRMAVALDNCFVGWRRRALIECPESGMRLVMAAEPPLDFLVVYTPAGRAFFCVEPVSHVTDAVNLAAAGRTDTGFRILEPGETLRTAVTLTPEP